MLTTYLHRIPFVAGEIASDAVGFDASWKPLQLRGSTVVAPAAVHHVKVLELSCLQLSHCRGHMAELVQLGQPKKAVIAGRCLVAN